MRSPRCFRASDAKAERNYVRFTENLMVTLTSGGPLIGKQGSTDD